MNIQEKRLKIEKEIPTLAPAINSIRKKFGESSLIWYGEAIKSYTNYDVVDTSLFGLNACLGNYGIVRGRQLEIFGPESSGKTTLMLFLISRIQRLGGMCAYIDVEQSFDPVYATNIGVCLESLIVAQPEDAEEALTIAEALSSSGAFDMIVLDSIGALVPKAIKEAGPGDSTVGVLARLLSQSVNRIVSLIAENKTIFCWINQVRAYINIGSFTPTNAPKETTPGGHVARHHYSYRMDVRRTSYLKRGDRVVGIESRVKIVKNKCAPPYRECRFELMFDDENNIWGVWRAADIFNAANNLKLITGAGIKSFKGIRLGNGEFNSKKFIHDNPEVMEKIVKELKTIYGYEKPLILRPSLVDIMPTNTIKDMQLIDILGTDKIDQINPESNEDIIEQLRKLSEMGIDIVTPRDPINIEQNIDEDTNVGPPVEPDLDSLMPPVIKPMPKISFDEEEESSLNSGNI